MKKSSDKEVYRVDEHIKVVLTHTKIQCTSCLKWKPASKFGMRHQHTRTGMTIRNQAQCTLCRGAYNDSEME